MSMLDDIRIPRGCKAIPVTNCGQIVAVAIVDKEDSDLAVSTWRPAGHGRYGHDRHYAAMRPQGGGTAYMHRIIAERAHGEIPDGWTVDHANHNTYDNRRENLRIATRSQNHGNRRSTGDGFRGVSRRSRGAGWRARLGIPGGEIPLGNFDNPEDAARAYDVAALARFGEFASLNFPDDIAVTTAGPNLPQLEAMR